MDYTPNQVLRLVQFRRSILPYLLASRPGKTPKKY